jgi:hypothetical protein
METFGAPLFDTSDVNLAATLLEVAPTVIVELFSFTISGCVWEYESRLKNGGGGAVAMRKKNEEGREAVKNKSGGSKFFPSPFIKGELPKDL